MLLPLSSRESDSKTISALVERGKERAKSASASHSWEEPGFSAVMMDTLLERREVRIATVDKVESDGEQFG
jgi:hypothetical protein